MYETNIKLKKKKKRINNQFVFLEFTSSAERNKYRPWSENA